MAERRGVELCDEGASALETRMDLLEENLDSILERLDVVDRRTEGIERSANRIEPLEDKVRLLDFRLNQLERDLKLPLDTTGLVDAGTTCGLAPGQTLPVEQEDSVPSTPTPEKQACSSCPNLDDDFFFGG